MQYQSIMERHPSAGHIGNQPFIDLLYEYKRIDPEGAKIAADEMTNALLEVGECKDFPETQIALIEECVGIAHRSE